MLATCTITTVPVSVFGSIVPRTRCSATIGAYSMPCVPAMSASTGPGLMPLTIENGISVPASPARGATRSDPDTVVPCAAVTPPRMKVVCAAAGGATSSEARSKGKSVFIGRILGVERT